MSRTVTVLCALTIGVALAGGSALAQSAPGKATAPVTENKRLTKQLAPQRRAAKRQKRTDCEMQATRQKLRLVKRWRFVRRCMAG